MPKGIRLKPEQIVAKLREDEVSVAHPVGRAVVVRCDLQNPATC